MVASIQKGLPYYCQGPHKRVRIGIFLVPSSDSGVEGDALSGFRLQDGLVRISVEQEGQCTRSPENRFGWNGMSSPKSKFPKTL